MKFKEIPLDEIQVKDNIRREADEDLSDLMDSIEQHEILQPVLVRPLKNGKYELVTGHRRFAAMKARNEATIPAVIRGDVTEGDRVFLQMTENGQRKQMSALEWVEAFEVLRKRDKSYTRARIGKLIGRSAHWVGNQYDAVRLGTKLVSEGEITKEEAKSFRAGQIIGRAQRLGLAKAPKGARDVTASMINAYTINVRCRDAAVVAMVLEAIDRVRDRVRKELESE